MQNGLAALVIARGKGCVSCPALSGKMYLHSDPQTSGTGQALRLQAGCRMPNLEDM